jgi:esterase/lipase
MRETVKFESIRGKNIFTIFSEPENGSKSVVILNHGFKGSSVGASRSFVNFTRLLVENGISVLRFDQPGSGNSGGDFADSSFNEWVETTAHLSQSYLSNGYQVALLGHSMGANTALAAATQPKLEGKIPLLLLWAPDPKTNPADWFIKDAKLIDESRQIFEEGGQQFRASYWQEVMSADFFGCLHKYQGKIHLVYGENDKFVSQELRNRVIQEATNKKHELMILKGQDHMMWDYEMCTKVFNEELELLISNYLI